MRDLSGQQRRRRVEGRAAGGVCRGACLCMCLGILFLVLPQAEAVLEVGFEFLSTDCTTGVGSLLPDAVGNFPSGGMRIGASATCLTTNGVDCSTAENESCAVMQHSVTEWTTKGWALEDQAMEFWFYPVQDKRGIVFSWSTNDSALTLTEAGGYAFVVVEMIPPSLSTSGTDNLRFSFHGESSGATFVRETFVALSAFHHVVISVDHDGGLGETVVYLYLNGEKLGADLDLESATISTATTAGMYHRFGGFDPTIMYRKMPLPPDGSAATAYEPSFRGSVYYFGLHNQNISIAEVQSRYNTLLPNNPIEATDGVVTLWEDGEIARFYHVGDPDAYYAPFDVDDLGQFHAYFDPDDEPSFPNYVSGTSPIATVTVDSLPPAGKLSLFYSGSTAAISESDTLSKSTGLPIRVQPVVKDYYSPQPCNPTTGDSTLGTMQVTADDTTTTSVGTISFCISPVNDPPQVTTKKATITAQATTIVDVQASDPDSNPADFRLIVDVLSPDGAMFKVSASDQIGATPLSNPPELLDTNKFAIRYNGTEAPTAPYVGSTNVTVRMVDGEGNISAAVVIVLNVLPAIVPVPSSATRAHSGSLTGQTYPEIDYDLIVESESDLVTEEGRSDSTFRLYATDLSDTLLRILDVYVTKLPPNGTLVANGLSVTAPSTVSAVGTMISHNLGITQTYEFDIDFVGEENFFNVPTHSADGVPLGVSNVSMYFFLQDRNTGALTPEFEQLISVRNSNDPASISLDLNKAGRQKADAAGTTLSGFTIDDSIDQGASYMRVTVEVERKSSAGISLDMESAIVPDFNSDKLCGINRDADDVDDVEQSRWRCEGDGFSTRHTHTFVATAQTANNALAEIYYTSQTSEADSITVTIYDGAYDLISEATRDCPDVDDLFITDKFTRHPMCNSSSATMELDVEGSDDDVGGTTNVDLPPQIIGAIVAAAIMVVLLVVVGVRHFTSSKRTEWDVDGDDEKPEDYTHVMYGDKGAQAANYTAQDIVREGQYSGPGEGMALTNIEDPQEWEEATDKQGRTYYFHRVTRRTTWTKPEGFVPQAFV